MTFPGSAVLRRFSVFLRSAAVALPLLLTGFVMASTSAQAAGPQPVALSAVDRADLSRVEAYLESIRTLKAKFEQFNPDGGSVSGDVYLSRPGKMRFQYAPPVQMSIISNGDYVAVDDKELKQVNFLPVASTPIWFLLREGIKLSGDVTVTRVEHPANTIRVTAVQTKDPSTGSITLVFADHPLQLVKWTILDGQGRSTTVVLENPQPGVTLATDLFVLPAASAAQTGRTR